MCVPNVSRIRVLLVSGGSGKQNRSRARRKRCSTHSSRFPKVRNGVGLGLSMAARLIKDHMETGFRFPPIRTAQSFNSVLPAATNFLDPTIRPESGPPSADRSFLLPQTSATSKQSSDVSSATDPRGFLRVLSTGSCKKETGKPRSVTYPLPK